jgi:hypothetical protein
LEKLWRLANQFGGEWGYTPVRPVRRSNKGFLLKNSDSDGWDDDD